MDLNLTEKVALITGSGSQIGFGHATALTLAKEGCDIIVNDINLEAAEQTASEIRNLGRQAKAIKADVGNSSQVKDMVKTAIVEFGKIDILVMVGLVLAFINPVIGGVLVGYIIWLNEPVVGLQLIVLSLTMMSLYVIGYIIWASKKFEKLEQRLKLLEGIAQE